MPPPHVQSCSFEIEPGPRYEVNLRVFAIAYHSLKMQLQWCLIESQARTICDSRGRHGFKSRSCQTLKTCNFEVLEVTAMYFTFLETSSLYLFGQERSGAQLHFQTMICYCEYPQVYFIKRAWFNLKRTGLYFTTYLDNL